MIRSTSNSDAVLMHLSLKQAFAVSFLIAYGYPIFVLLALQPFAIMAEGRPFNGFTITLQTIYSLLLISIVDAPTFLAIALSAFIFNYRRMATRAIAIVASTVINHYECKELVDSVYILDVLWKFGLNSGIGRLSITITSASAILLATTKLTAQDKQQPTRTNIDWPPAD